jgi:hypothetical protein
MSKPREARAVPYKRMLHDEAAAMFSAWQAQKKKLSD